jgi:hypothetical protein
MSGRGHGCEQTAAIPGGYFFFKKIIAFHSWFQTSDDEAKHHILL